VQLRMRQQIYPDVTNDDRSALSPPTFENLLWRPTSVNQIMRQKDDEPDEKIQYLD